jgi:hypothetical protein
MKSSEILKKEIELLRRQGEERDIKLVTDMMTLLRNTTKEKQLLEEMAKEKKRKR